MTTDIEIARAARLLPIDEIAARVGLLAGAIEPYGRYKAKLPAEALAHFAGRPKGKLILVTAVNPTPAGEGKTTTSVGLADGREGA
jgi:formate--tetrahydrofolate ligase